MKKNILKLVVSLVMFFSLISFASTCFAFRVAPAKIEGLTVKRGKTATAVLSLTRSVIDEKIKLYLTDIITGRRGNFSFEKLKDWKYSASEWITLHKVRKVEEETREGVKAQTIRIISPIYKEREVLILKKSPTYIGIEVKAPYNVKPGQYYACIMVEPTEFTPIKRGITVLNVMSRIAVPIIIEVPGRLPRITGKAVSSEAEVKEEEIKVLATFENTGNILEEVRGKARIINKENKRLYDIVTLKALNASSPDGMGKVFPETLRDFEGKVTRPLPAGEYEVRVAFDFGRKGRKAQTKTSFTVTEAVAVKQKELLILAVKPELLEYSLIPGGYHIEAVKVENIDIVESMEIEAQSSAEWIKVSPDKFKLAPGRSRKIKVMVRIPRDTETVERSGKIAFKAERGKLVFVDVVVHNAREKKEEKKET